MMTWDDLYIVMQDKMMSCSNFHDEAVVVYDAENGAFNQADVLDFCESDGIIDAGKTCISINVKEEWNEQS